MVFTTNNVSFTCPYSSAGCSRSQIARDFEFQSIGRMVSELEESFLYWCKSSFIWGSTDVNMAEMEPLIHFLNSSFVKDIFI